MDRRQANRKDGRDYYGVHIDPDTREILDSAAEETNRSRSGMVRQIVKEWHRNRIRNQSENEEEECLA